MTKQKTLEEEALVSPPFSADNDIIRAVEFGQVEGTQYFKFDRTISNPPAGLVDSVAVNVFYKHIDVHSSKNEAGYLVQVVEVEDNRAETNKGCSVFLSCGSDSVESIDEVRNYCIDYISVLRSKQIELFRKRGYFIKDWKDSNQAAEPSSSEARR